MSETSRHHRLFIAADLPAEVREILGAAGRDVAAEYGGRAVSPGNLHVTLAFLGDVPADRLEGLLEGLGRWDPGPIAPVGLGTVVGRPSQAHARLAAVEIQDGDGALTDLAARVRAVAGDLHTDQRLFWPHVTVARFIRPTRMRRSPTRQSEHVFDIDHVSLYDSHTTPSGPPRYERLLGIPLDGTLAERKISNG